MRSFFFIHIISIILFITISCGTFKSDGSSKVIAVRKINLNGFGQIMGRVIHAKTGEPLIGVNIILEGTNIGSSTDLNGTYKILNVTSGLYSLKTAYLGFKTKKYKRLNVKKDNITIIDFQIIEDPNFKYH